MGKYIIELPKDAVRIKGALEYVDTQGNIYGVEHRKGNPNKGSLYIKAQSTIWGYKYCTISYENGTKKTKRVHRLVAEAFILNPDNLPIVMHKDNNKKNNCVDNLKWGTIKENTIQACKDGLATNDMGWEDSQSMPVDKYDAATNTFVCSYGSAREAERETGISRSTILLQCRNTDKKIRKPVYFVFHGAPPRKHDVIVAYDMETDAEIGRFANTRIAGEYFGVDANTVCAQIQKGKPKWAKANAWFDRITI